MKSFRSTRQVDRRADLPQVVEAALKVRLVGQHADAGRTVLLVGAGDRDRIEVGADHALDGLAFFTSAISRMGGPCGQRGKEIAQRRGVGQPLAQAPLRASRLWSGNLLPLGGDDFVENGGHAELFSLRLVRQLYCRTEVMAYDCHPNVSSGFRVPPMPNA